MGEAFSAAEVNFFNAYRLHADRLGLTRDLDVSDAEIETNTWRDCLLNYAEKYPESVARFPDQRELLGAIGAQLRHRRITEMAQSVLGQHEDGK